MTSSLCRVLALLVPVVAASVPLWPLPSAYSAGTSSFVLSPSFSFHSVSDHKSHVLEAGIKRYDKLIGSSSASSSDTNIIQECDIKVETILSTLSEELDSLNDYAVDTSYSLDIDQSGKCLIQAKTVWGGLYAMETFTQLLTRESSVALNYVPVSIQDVSRYAHRGVLIDTSRHYLSKTKILEIIDTLVMQKFNVLHWHIVDAQSFPLDSTSAPNIVKGAYSPSMIYSLDVINEIMTYANYRGIRVIFEIDIPGHAASWNAGYPSIMADCFEKYYYNINDFALNPAIDETYSIVNSILGDIINSTNSKYIHLGGDEVVYGCWNEDAEIVDFMSTNNIASYNELLNYFVTKVDKQVNAMGASVIHWEEVFFAGVEVSNSNTIYEVWTNSSQVAKVTNANFNVIAAPSDVWYLDHLSTTWKTMYAYDPETGLDETQAKYIIGGETCLWGEYIDDSNFIQTAYPRASAVAERLWSPNTVVDQVDALARLTIQRCRMVARGHESAPVQPDACLINYV